MVLYITQRTADKYLLKMPHELSNPMKPVVYEVMRRERGKSIFEWGAKLFYFEGKKCLQVMNFETKLTFFLFNVTMTVMEELAKWLVDYMFLLYSDNDKMTKCIKKYVDDSKFIYFDLLEDKNIITTINHTHRIFVEEERRLYDFMDNGVPNVAEINRKINFEWFFPKKEGDQICYFYSGKMFEEVLAKKYGDV